jgi:hypothetical protein
VASRKQTSSQAPKRRGDWLRREQTSRTRRWALEEHLLDGKLATDKEGLIDALAGRLVGEQTALSRLEAELDVQARRVAELEDALQVLGGWDDEGMAAQAAAIARDPPRRTVDLRSPQAPLDDDYRLCRCEGFVVESPIGVLGVVTGLRFGTRIDRPDLLEIEVGRLRPKLLLVPIEEVEHISVDEERVLLSRDPRPHPDLVHELLLRARDKLRPLPL